jgi:ELWxxDGT repeat protein
MHPNNLVGDLFMSLKLIFILCLFLAGSHKAFAQPQPVQLLLENHPTGDTFFSNSYPEIGGEKYFSVNTNGSGVSYFKTDGTIEGTVKLDLNTSSALLGGVTDIIELNDKILAFNVFFWGTGGYTVASEPAFIDPADGEITLLKDINETDNGSSGGIGAYKWADQVFFIANDGVHGHELWVTDGTSEGTVMVREIVEGTSGINSIEYAHFGDELILIVNGDQIWKTDGSTEGTVQVKNLSGENGFISYSRPEDFVESNDKLYFSFYSLDGFRFYLWETDGTTEGTLQTTSDFFNNLRVRKLGNDVLVFNQLNAVEIHKLNVLTSEFEIVKSVETGGISLTSVFQPLADKIYFTTNNKLWKTDGTEAGTELVKEIPGMVNGSQGIHELPGGELLFLAESNAFGFELWKTDGTEEGTQIVKDIFPGQLDGGPYYYTTLGDKVIFSANDGIHGRELWVSDGSEVGTLMFKDFNTTLAEIKLGSIASTASQFVLVADNDDFALPNIYSIDDGAAGNLTTLSNESLNPTFSNYDNLVTYENSVYTLASEIADGQVEFFGLVKIANNQIELVKQINFGSNLQVIGDKMLFTADPLGTDSREMWVSDGTSDGTYELTDIAPGATDAFSYGKDDGLRAIMFNGNVYFSANDQTHGYELWASDLTTEGTHLVKDINTGSNGSKPRSFEIFNSQLFFLAENSSDKSALWFSDGGEAGTNQLIEFDKEVDFVEYHSTSTKLFLSVAFSDDTYELYSTAGTSETTEFLANAGSYNYSAGSPFIGFDNKALFITQEWPDNYYNVYGEDGTVENIYTGYYYLDGALDIDGLLYLSVGNNYLYKTDGTENSFELVYDFYLEAGGLFEIRKLNQFGKDLYFQANKDNSRTPWRLPILYSKAEIEFDGLVRSSGFEIDFGEEAYGSATASQPVTISNKGYVPLLFTGPTKFELAGANPGDFQLNLNGISDKINPDNVGEIGISFTPASAGIRSASLLIQTNDEDTPLIEIALTGSGVKTTPIVSFSEIPTKSILDEPFALTASVDTDQEISFSSSNPEIASIEGKTVTIHKAGTVTITASVVETELYNAASKQQSLTINGVEQTITFNPLPEKTYGDVPFDLSATASSGLDVTFSSSDAAVASIEGVTVTILKAGSATITASQVGNDNYSSAAATQTLTINKAAQTITFEALPAKTFGDEPFVLSASSTSGLTLAYASSDATVAKVDGTTLTLLKPGSATITASQAGSDNYLAAASVEQSLVVNKAGQTITFEPLATKTYGDPAFELSAASSVGLPIVFSSSDPAVVSVEGNSALIVKAGAVTITASQAGNDNYNTASAEQTLTVAKAPQTITFDELPTLQSDDEPIELIAEASSGLLVSFQSEDEAIATIEGATLTITGSGTTSITATQGGDENYLAAAAVARTLVVEEVTGLGNELTEKVRVYPNPMQGQLIIEHASVFTAEFSITSISGKLISKGILADFGTTTIDTKHLPEGIYLLTISNDKITTSYRIIKGQ